jgi:hypothetical protein
MRDPHRGQNRQSTMFPESAVRAHTAGGCPVKTNASSGTTIDRPKALPVCLRHWVQWQAQTPSGAAHNS